jgi:hypothetical protein
MNPAEYADQAAKVKQHQDAEDQRAGQTGQLILKGAALSSVIALIICAILSYFHII